MLLNNGNAIVVISRIKTNRIKFFKPYTWDLKREGITVDSVAWGDFMKKYPIKAEIANYINITRVVGLK